MSKWHVWDDTFESPSVFKTLRDEENKGKSCLGLQD